MTIYNLPSVPSEYLDACDSQTAVWAGKRFTIYDAWVFFSFFASFADTRFYREIHNAEAIRSHTDRTNRKS